MTRLMAIITWKHFKQPKLLYYKKQPNNCISVLVQLFEWEEVSWCICIKCRLQTVLSTTVGAEAECWFPMLKYIRDDRRGRLTPERLDDDDNNDIIFLIHTIYNSSRKRFTIQIVCWKKCSDIIRRNKPYNFDS